MMTSAEFFAHPVMTRFMVSRSGLVIHYAITRARALGYHKDYFEKSLLSVSDDLDSDLEDVFKIEQKISQKQTKQFYQHNEYYIYRRSTNFACGGAKGLNTFKYRGVE